MTQVFISWSGDLSKALADELRTWIPSVLQFAKPYFTPNDIEKGAKWSSEISKRLSDTHVGIICLTRENIEKPWILFEAGALSKDLENSRLCSILFGIENTDLSGPLTTFQNTQFEKSDFKKLVVMINDAGGDAKLDKDTFDKVFEMWWPQLETKVREIISNKNGGDEAEIRSDREILEEILSLTRVSSRPTTSRREMGTGVLTHLAEQVDKLVAEAKGYSDKNILRTAEEILEAISYIAVSTGSHSKRLSVQLESSQLEIDRVKTRFDSSIKSSEIDDEIPF